MVDWYSDGIRLQSLGRETATQVCNIVIPKVLSNSYKPGARRPAASAVNIPRAHIYTTGWCMSWIRRKATVVAVAVPAEIHMITFEISSEEIVALIGRISIRLPGNIACN